MSVFSRSKSPEILIVGAGPAGLILALALLQNDVPVRIIEKTTHPRIGQRGSGITPRSLEVFEALGIVNQVLKKAINVPKVCLYKLPGGTEVLKEIERATLEPTPTCPYVNFRQLGQDSLDRIIQADIQKYGCAVELGVELLSVEQSDDHTNVKILNHRPGGGGPTQQDMTYKWVIGADSAKSVVRKQLGLSFLGEATEENMVVGDIRIEGLSEDRIHVWGDLSSTMTAIRPSETSGVFTIIAGGPKFGNPETICVDEAALKEALRQSTGNRSDIKFGEIICMNPYRPQIRMVDEFRKGGIFVTGDAGHVHSPPGGQGMNTGIQDSFNLGWKLALVAKQLAPPSLLDTYSEERLPVVAEMLNITTSLLKKTIKNFNDEADLIQTILIVGKEQGKEIDVVNPHGVRAFKDRDNHGNDAFLGSKNDGKFGVFVIRPDRVLGARVQSPQGLESYFQSIFGKTEENE
ncbi:hypothetical protein NLJ89_g1721 [Agrocybe chaxingu]|uniref:FAD-binding domain-containing protein n=1 Tax=Agrocybe chaxingu TaxID=84603 RepID=A0A9W8MZH5_9AGAR|nr:hypothetical protein NLJ89_g1721 [Agrocybe chaxingu]